MPWVQINMLEGRSADKKKKLHELVNAAVAEALEIPKEAIKVQIVDMPFENYSVAGVCQDKKKPG